MVSIINLKIGVIIEICTTHMYITNVDKIVFGIRGGLYHFRGLTAVAKIIKGILKNMLLWCAEHFNGSKMDPKSMHNVTKGEISLTAAQLTLNSKPE
jgi:hypothetical protein